MYSVTIQKPLRIRTTQPSITAAQSFPNSYCYPILSQTTSYRTGDEGWQIANVWNSIYGAIDTRKAVIGLTDFYTLDANNSFGNTRRFTLDDGTEPSLFQGGDTFEMYDHYLGIIISRDGVGNLGEPFAVRNWNEWIDAALTYDGGGWYLMPTSFYASICDPESTGDQNNYLDIFFANGVGFSATTFAPSTTLARTFGNNQGIGTVVKTNTRNHGFIYKLIP